jgi:hypothetical protein
MKHWGRGRLLGWDTVAIVEIGDTAYIFYSIRGGLRALVLLQRRVQQSFNLQCNADADDRRFVCIHIYV